MIKRMEVTRYTYFGLCILKLLHVCRLIITGWRRPLQNSDLWSLNPSDTSQIVAPKLANSWQRQLNKARSVNDDDVMMM